MNIAIVLNNILPAQTYGGTERVIWGLAKALSTMGHKVSLICGKGSRVPFAQVIERDPSLPLERLIPADADVVHFQEDAPDNFQKPYIITCHGNRIALAERQRSMSVYVSRNHAERHGCSAFVHNGLDWSAYPSPAELPPMRSRCGFHFLGKAAWRAKNVKGAINVALKASDETIRLRVLGGDRLCLKMGFRLTLSPRIRFHGMVTDTEKARIILNSRGLIFPIRWHEPFGLAVTESLYLGAPVFATPYGSMPELITPEVGFMCADSNEMAAHIRECGGDYSPSLCHEYAATLFSAEAMARNYLKLYEQAANGLPLNTMMTPPEADPMARLPWQ